jgi:hypothetical protein
MDIVTFKAMSIPLRAEHESENVHKIKADVKQLNTIFLILKSEVSQ